jgi:ABC-type bacteriocin/lantibiotic exporter with double-glycine peptidase domain
MPDRRAAWRFLGRTLVRQRWGIALAILSGLSWQAAAIFAPLLVKLALDRGIVHGDTGALHLLAASIVGLV